MAEGLRDGWATLIRPLKDQLEQELPTPTWQCLAETTTSVPPFAPQVPPLDFSSINGNSVLAQTPVLQDEELPPDIAS